MLYGEVRRQEFKGVEWDEATYNAFIAMQFRAREIAYKQQFPDRENLIIEVDFVPAGAVIVADTGGELRLVDIVISPEYRRRGVAREVISRLKERAADVDQPLTLHVDVGNVAAIRLYESLGFQTTGTGQLHYRMEWRRLSGRV